jgi:hypothetical protein
MGHPNSKKHKAQHCGYKRKPAKKEVNALMGLYAGISNVVIKQAPVKKQAGVQLKLDF